MKLNVEQRRIVELEPSGHMMVKGVAGSGKTTVSIRRLPFLLNNYCPERDDKILLVTFNKTLLNYIKYQYIKVENEEEYQSDFFQDKNGKVEITTVDSLMYKYFMTYSKRNKMKIRMANKHEIREATVKAAHEISKKFPQVKIISPKNTSFLMDEIDWIKACNITDIDVYQTIDRVGRAGVSDGTPQKLLKNSSTREAIFSLMNTYDSILEKDGMTDFKSMNLIALEEAHRSGERFAHIIIDESQDLTKVQLEFLKAIYNDKEYSSIMFVADNTQSIYSQSWLGKGRPYTTIGYDMSGRSRTLSKNYRTTTEISTAAFSLIENDESIQNNVDFVKPVLIDRQGHPPIYNYFKTSEKQLEFLVGQIRLLKNDYKYSEICIVGRQNMIIEDVEKGLIQQGVPAEILQKDAKAFDTEKVKLITMHSIKGLEFKVIFLIDINEGVIPNKNFTYLEDEEAFDSDERKLLYVGMTRANEILYISSVGRASKFIKEIGREHLRMKKDCGLRPFKSISISEYRFKENVIDINSREESVRQWMIKELNEVYDYPLDLIELEYPVQQFSQRGYVDICVNIFVNGIKRPYLFIEVKSFGIGIDGAADQLQSYMNSNDQVRYGVATDGSEILIINRDGEIIYDIPKCNSHFLPETREERKYLNLKNQRKYIYAYEKDDASNIEIKDIERDIHVELGSVASIPVLGEVAAGIPIEVNPEYDRFLDIPEDWISSKKETFILKVTGDSMNGAGIDRGDLVVVNRKNYASQGDIVIAVINNEATMKEYMPMGDTVILVSKNPDYEPIQMKQEDVIINGEVIGVMKM